MASDHTAAQTEIRQITIAYVKNHLLALLGYFLCFGLLLFLLITNVTRAPTNVSVVKLDGCYKNKKQKIEH